jgi:hypothetical protein
VHRSLLLAPLLALACSDLDSGDDFDLVVHGERFAEVNGAVTKLALLDVEAVDVDLRDAAVVRFGRFHYDLPQVIPDGSSRVVHLWVDANEDGRCDDGEVRRFVAAGSADVELVVRPGDGDPGD